MPSMQIVFLFDLNAYNDDKLKISPDFNKKLLCLRLACLKLLTHFYTHEPNLKWGFKFFDSSGPLSQIMCKFAFPNLSLENFEILENEITVRYQRHFSYISALCKSVQRNDQSISEKTNLMCENDIKNFYPVQVLQLALTQVLYEYQWNNQMTLFSPSRKFLIGNEMNKKDILFLITKCPKSEDDFLKYFGISFSSITPMKFSKILLSRSLHEQLLSKSSILWTWLNTDTENFLGELTSGILTNISELLKNLKCSLIPLSVLACLPNISKFELNETQLFRMNLFHSLLPFSKILSESITYSFYSNNNAVSRHSTICFQQQEIFVLLTRIPLYKNENNKLPLNHSENTNLKDSNTKDILSWSKFHVHFSTTKVTYYEDLDILLCLPSVITEDSNFIQFQNLNKSLVLKNISLFITCESTCGLTLPGLFTPISDMAAVISIWKPDSFFKHVDTFPFKNASLTNHIINENSEEKEKHYSGSIYHNCVKPFQIETLERWYTPSNSIRQFASLNKDSKNRSQALNNFYKKISLKLSNNEKISPEKENIAPNNDGKDTICPELPEVIDVSGLSYDELIKTLTATYDLAIKSDHSVLYSAKKIIKTGYSFFQENPGSRPLEELLKDFLTEFFYVRSQTIIEKNEMKQENIGLILEFQLQVLLRLEAEIVAPSSNTENCINDITLFLRSMSFYSETTELDKFLNEILKENYKDSLYDILVEIGDELNIPLFEEEDDSPYELSEPPSSESMLGSNNSILSNILSAKSSSSSSSRTGNKKPIKIRSDIDNSKKPQVLLTRSSPKRKKYKNLCPGKESIPTRYSPRLSSKRKRERSQKQINPGNVRRNLFPKDQKLSTPKYSQSPRGKKRMRTPKAYHVLKTSFVAETPTSKQNRSALQRRKSFMDTDDSETSLTEIAESPKIKSNSKNSTQSELLKKLNDLESETFTQPNYLSKPSCSTYSQYTPESKRRLSLKLFSKILTSPTARTGLKKCSKRLFDQVSPQVGKTLHKKPRLDLDSNTDSQQEP